MTYRIHTPTATYEATVNGGQVTAVSRPLQWAKGQDFVHLRRWAENHGFLIEPVIEQNRTWVFDHRASRYEVTIFQGVVLRVTKDDEDITWQQLPEDVKALI